MNNGRIVHITGWLRILSDVVHILIALSLLFSAAFLMISAFINLKSMGRDSIFHFINEILFVLIIMEIFVTVITYLREHRVTFQPFLVVGIIASIRKILTIEAHLAIEEGIGSDVFSRSMIELGVNTLIVFILVISFYLLAKAPGPSDCPGCLGIEDITKKLEALISERKEGSGG
ncbi:MAG: phosphate-starvation-inducible PsiE family protein [Nitrospinota bacterium]